MKNLMLKKVLVGVALLALFGCGDDSKDSGLKVSSNSFSPNGKIPNTLTVTRFDGKYKITGILKKGNRLIAIINEKMVTAGTELDPGVVLISIQPTYAIISFGNAKFLIRPTEIQNKLNTH
jgi:hypothetical protein